eukprot:g28546.t1
MGMSHQVDLTRFGKGTASTLSQFYETVVLEEKVAEIGESVMAEPTVVDADMVRKEKCMLKVEDNRLFRMVELVRIILHFRNEEGHQRELRIKSEVTAGGQLRERNQPLAVVLRNDEHGGWESAVERCLSSKFGLSPAVQRACFNMPKDAYTYQENKGHSETIPGIPTKYKTHTIKMTVKDPSDLFSTRNESNASKENSYRKIPIREVDKEIRARMEIVEASDSEDEEPRKPSEPKPLDQNS